MATTGLIEVKTRYVAPAEAALPGLGVHITRLVDSYMVWVGVTEEVEDARGALCRDWACAMPPAPGSTQPAAATTTTLYRTSGSDVASSMARRLAKRIHKAVFLSVDIDSSLHGTRLLLDAEKGVVETVLELERSSLASPAL